MAGGPAARWYAYAASTDRDRYTYGYDRASNRLYRENTLASGRDELYGYDQVNRLIAFQRGELNATKDGITGTPVKAEEWGLDTTGNWDAFLQKTSGTTDLDQARTHNPVNEITAITAATGTDWADPAHDRAGNMTTIPKPANLADGLTAIYDAWNRLVEVKDGATVIARYEYDGLNRRIKSHIDSGAPSNPTGIDSYIHYYHNSAWQILETRQTDTQSAAPETLQPKHQYVWSQRYIDAAVLRDENTGVNGLCDDQRLYYLNDANFNVTALLNTAGDAVERYLYSPYGVVTIYDATWTNTRNESSYANVTLYTGRELDRETGLYYYRNRYYSAQLGRFVSRDRIGYEAGDLSVYRYSRNRPLTYRDPNGLTSVLPDRPPKNVRDNNGCCAVTGIRMICRSMPAAWHLPGMTHCYMVFENEDGKALDILSGQQIDDGKLGLSDFFWDNNYFTGEWSANQTEYPVVVPVGASLCSIYDCMYGQALRMHGQSNYNQYTNNSNTFLSNLIASCHLTVRFPWSAIASKNPPGPCLRRCLGVQNLVSAPEWKIRECKDRCSALDDGGSTYEPT